MSKPIRILHVVGNMDRGGTETLLMSIYRNIDRERVQFDFVEHTNFESAYDSEIRSLGGRIFRIPRYKVFNHFNYIKYWEDLFTENEFTAVHGHINSTACIYLKVAKSHNIPTIAHSHNVNTGIGIKSKVKKLYNKNINLVSDYKFACSEDAGHSLYGANFYDFKVIKNGIEVDKFIYNHKKRSEIRKELELPEDSFVIGHIGNYNPVKNHQFVVSVFEDIYGGVNESKLILIGKDVENNIKNTISNREIVNSILFLGSRSDVPDLLNAIDVFVLPSKIEGLGLSLIESQASGLVSFASTNVPKETKITNLLHYLPINSVNSVSTWAKEIVKYQEYLRVDKRKEILENGYDIRTTASYLETFYTNII